MIYLCIYALIGFIWWFIRVDWFSKEIDRQGPIPPESVKIALFLMVPICVVLWPMFMLHTLLGLGKE